ncbi:metal-dependent hydrolase [Smaragdicoccus niigatensis]|uniref:metal-dependent hydrolase n=1 Tax=Smaragdicoccus niigatensis TaxID=359359 RepID=UPI00036BE028|nr:metal-dependent hydrolase [Smaragdicoccus niigatensis]
MAESRPYQAKHRDVKVRRLQFDYPIGSRFQHFVDGDLVMSHAVAVLSGMFPEGEDFFVRSVRDLRDRVTDPELKAQVAGFIGQEVTHGREHRVLNERLGQMGYRSMKVDRHVRRLLRLVEKLNTRRRRVGVTAALEHYTATFAEVLLEDPDAQRLLGNTEVRNLLLWHALEESEHKAVAFDVYRAAAGWEWLRIWIMRTTTVIFILEVVGHTALSMLRDRATYNPRTLIRSLAALRHNPFLKRHVWQRLRSYNRRGFHPDDWDATNLIEQWKVELFGEHGTLADHLR